MILFLLMISLHRLEAIDDCNMAEFVDNISSFLEEIVLLILACPTVAEFLLVNFSALLLDILLEIAVLLLVAAKPFKRILLLPSVVGELVLLRSRF